MTEFKKDDYVECEHFIGKIMSIDNKRMLIHVLQTFGGRAYMMREDKTVEEVDIGSPFAKYELRLLQVRWSDYVKMHEILYG